MQLAELVVEMEAKNILVIGGSHGIGLGISQKCLAGGASVTVIARTPGGLDLAHPRLNYVAADVVEEQPMSTALPESIDGFVYCPGSINLGPLRGVDLATIRADFELNVISAVKYMQLAMLPLKKSSAASCVFFSSVAATQGLPMHTSIAAAKAALEALTRTWAAELAPAIRVNCIAPALTDTPLAERFLSSDAKREAMAAKYPLGRVGLIEDLASCATFLLSCDSAWMTGQVLHVDGGLSTIRK